MRDRPTGEDLLASARKVLREQVLPSLPADHKHAALMVLNAMSIAERQLHYGEDPERQELAALSGLLDESFGELGAANRSLAMALRKGDGDPGQPRRAALFAQLRVMGRQRLRESNPKVLPAGDAA